jgi:ATP-dependent DNA helicase DinG
MQMALLLEKAISREIPTLVEAGTGTGKTFGYLVPIILSRKKAVISTGTKNLQEQIYFKDLPFLVKIAGLSVEAVLMKGRKNYLCLYKYHQYGSQASFLESGTGRIKQRLERWLQATTSGDRAEIPWLADDDTLWDALSSTSDQCLGTHCVVYEDCFLNRLRANAAKAKIIIVNHHLFFADLKVKEGGFGEVIPRFQVAVFDEAHDIEEIATTYLGESLSTQQLAGLVSDAEKGLKGAGGIETGQIQRHLNAIRAGAEEIRTLFDGQGDRGRLDPATLTTLRKGPAQRIREGLKYVCRKISLGEGEPPDLQPLVLRAEALDGQLEAILRERDLHWLNWYERRGKRVVLHASPLHISERLNEHLYKKVKTLIFTSATLSTHGTFDYIRSRLGVGEDALEGLYPSHFDFETQALLYIPKDLSSPVSRGFVREAAERIGDILKRTRGRALVLFTSHHNLNLAYEILRDVLPFTLHKQGDAPRSMILDAFRRDIHSVLLATGSFWQGVDVPGEALSCLIIDKLPFESPGEPLVSARIDGIRGLGGNPFLDYQVPSAIIALKQGLGRLIRKSTDRGVLSVLDTRLMTRAYGRLFLESLPKIPITHDLSDIDGFFGRDMGVENAPSAVEGDLK